MSPPGSSAYVSEGGLKTSSMSFKYPAPGQLTHMTNANDTLTQPPPGHSVDKGSCRLLGPTALVVQALMGGLVIASLIYKRQREKPMRPWRIWTFDVSKQILGQIFVHGLNLIISDLVAQLAHGNPCNLYFLNILIDTTLGVSYIYLVLHGTDKFFTDCLKLEGFHSGQYGDPPSLAFWARQAAVYVFIILTMKLLVIGLFAVWPSIFDVGEWLLGWTGGNNRVQVIFVMGIFPIFMNVLQFWLIDSIVKASASGTTGSPSRTTDDGTQQPLFHSPDDDDEEDEVTIRGQRRYDIESPPTPQVTSVSRTEQISTTKPSASGPSGPAESSSMNQHLYPPISSLPATVNTDYNPTSSAAVSTSSSVSSFGSKKSKRRSPPPPIIRPPHMSADTDYIISMTPSPVVSKASQRSLSLSSPSPLKGTRQRRPSTHASGGSRSKTLRKPETQKAFDWNQEDDWAENVGKEEWTGRRIGVTKTSLEVWGNKANASLRVS